MTEITSIGDWFLSECTSLTTFDTQGLTQVTSIGGGFLARCTSLTTFDTRGLTQVTSIGAYFLWNTTLSQQAEDLKNKILKRGKQK